VEFPINYLGVSLSVTKLPRSVLQPIVDRLPDKLPTWKGTMMHHSRRRALVKTTLLAMSIYMSITVGLPTWLLKACEKIMCAFLWTDTDVV
jgi:hypothetical protein